MSADEICARLTTFIRDELCPDEAAAVVTETTPLLESGLLDSLRTAQLLNFVRIEFGTAVPASAIEFSHFRTARSIAALVHQLRTE